MPILHPLGWLVVGTLGSIASSSVSALTTRLTVLALNASRNPEQSQRVRLLLEDLLANIQDCESELGAWRQLDRRAR